MEKKQDQNTQQATSKPIVKALLVAIENAENGKTFKVYRDSYTVEKQSYNYYSVFGKQADHDHAIRILPNLGFIGKEAKESEVKGKKGDGYDRIASMYDCGVDMYLGARGVERTLKSGEIVPDIEFFVFVSDEVTGIVDECAVVASSDFSRQRLVALFSGAFGAREMTAEEVKAYLAEHKSDE